MKRALLILLLGAVLGTAGYCSLYFSRTARARSLQSTEQPELAWLREEFCLSDSEFNRIRELHEGYLPQCAAMCARIAAVNAELQRLVIATNTVTPPISGKLAEIGDLRQQCQRMMLSHFYAVAATMPADQGHRYLEQMQALTSLSNMRDHGLAEHVAPHSQHSEHVH